MTDRTKMIADTNLDGQKYGVFYYPSSQDVYGASKIQSLTAVFESLPIDGGADLLSWKDVSWTKSVTNGARLYVYVRSSSTILDLSNTPFDGPYLNTSKNLAGFEGRYLQISMVLYSSMETGAMTSPIVNSLGVSCNVSTGAQLFFTKKFELGFKPKHILLTYNGSVSEGSLIQFAVAGKNSSDQDDYQVITPNKVAQLDDLPYMSDGIKVMMRATGSTEVPFSIDEFALALSGEDQKVIS